jgi:hypothetical protein
MPLLNDLWHSVQEKAKPLERIIVQIDMKEPGVLPII